MQIGLEQSSNAWTRFKRTSLHAEQILVQPPMHENTKNKKNNQKKQLQKQQQNWNG
jgi:hypothetical protein